MQPTVDFPSLSQAICIYNSELFNDFMDYFAIWCRSTRLVLLLSIDTSIGIGCNYLTFKEIGFILEVELILAGMGLAGSHLHIHIKGKNK